MKRIAILGSTGSIGRSTLNAIENNPERFQLVTATSRAEGSELIANGSVAPDVSRTVPVNALSAGRVIEIHDGVRQIKGVTRGLNALGALRVETDGKIEEIYSGDVISWQ